jgi:hypothetical protein
MTTKKCSKCGDVKSVNEFRVDKWNKSGLRSNCRKCDAESAKRYRECNPEKYKESKKKYNSSDKGKAKNREWAKNNPDKVRAKKKRYNDSHKEENSAYKKEYRSRKEVKESIREYDRKYHKVKMETDLLYKCKRMTRGVLSGAFRRMMYTKKSRSYEILGCSWEFFKGYLEGQFAKGMTWDNKDEWHIDHIIPLATAKTEEDVIRLNHYSNLRPIWAEENLLKSDKIIEGLQFKIL